ncbi:hypothetical protein TNCT_326561 [Trichonephila clavata]|uniref:Uncharacterized protein n=1 Tax=Trichonephila clavata TaxID=2740835 RepID=A0A8X6KCS1_TRICU|nr:hypothetical protein TNCT_326561 [Trichonephila clavata]
MFEVHGYCAIKIKSDVQVLTKMCVELCKLQKLLDMDECIDKDVDYPHTEELCKRGVFPRTNSNLEPNYC